jgi:spore coat protein SA
MSAIYHLLDESEVFSERDGGAISRWAANTLEEGDEIVICPSHDTSWGFPRDRLYQLPNWSLTSPIHPILYRLPWELQKTAYLSVFRPLFERLRPGDILYTHNRPESAAVLATMAERIGFRLVLHMHNSHLIRANKGQLAALKNSTIVFCSRFLLNEATAALPNHFQDTHVVYNGADSEKFRPSEEKRNAQPHIIFTGRLMPYKGVHILIDAMKILEDRGVDTRCTIVGGSGFGNSPRTRYVRRIQRRKAKNTEFAGYLSGHKFASLLRSADIFCCPSIWHDPFPLAPLEAMASGLPVVASRTGGLPETLAHGGGVLVPPRDATALADTLEALIKDPVLIRRLGAEALEAFRNHFLWSNARSQYQHVVESLRA